MSEAKSSGNSKRASDKTDEPKAVIITHRPILKDPDTKTTDSNKERAADARIPSSSLNTLKPTGNVTGPEEDEKQAGDTKDESVSESEPTNSVTVPELPTVSDEEKSNEDEKADNQTSGADKTSPLDDAETSDDEKEKTESIEEAEAAEAEKQAAHDAEIQKLADDKKYFLPINTVEKRKTKRFVILGIVLSIILAVAWVDVALDAGLIHLGGIKPVTHFFSN